MSTLNYNDDKYSSPIHRQKFSEDVYLGNTTKLSLRIEVEAWQAWEEVCRACALKSIQSFISKKYPTKPINILFDGPPAPESGRFVEVETDDGKGVNAGEWSERPDGYWALRITELPLEETDV